MIPDSIRASAQQAPRLSPAHKLSSISSSRSRHQPWTRKRQPFTTSRLTVLRSTKRLSLLAFPSLTLTSLKAASLCKWRPSQTPRPSSTSCLRCCRQRWNLSLPWLALKVPTRTTHSCLPITAMTHGYKLASFLHNDRANQNRRHRRSHNRIGLEADGWFPSEDI
jgi:hypothetical protein